MMAVPRPGDLHAQFWRDTSTPAHDARHARCVSGVKDAPQPKHCAITPRHKSPGCRGKTTETLAPLQDTEYHSRMLATAKDVAARFSDVQMFYGPAQVLTDLNLVLRQGDIHALVGENGAGKSTCLNLLGGRISPTRGDVEIFGEPFRGGTHASRRHGVAAVYQELSVVASMSAIENAFLGRERIKRDVFRDRSTMRAEFLECARTLDVQIDPNARVRDLPPAVAQLLEIMRALLSNARMILFDEPTASLGAVERESLGTLMSRLKRDLGMTQLLVDHDLDNVLRVADTTGVMRNGQLVETRPNSEWTRRELVSAMSTSPMVAAVQNQRSGPATDAACALRVSGLQAGKFVRDFDLTVQKGQILGIAGLVGSGRSTILRCIAGAQRPAVGTMSMGDRQVAWPKSVISARALGIQFIPEDRKLLGLVLHSTARDSILLGGLKNFTRFGIVRTRAARAAVESAADRASLSLQRLDSRVDELSGGNQQKVLIARAVNAEPRVLLADEPTRGVDLNARVEIHRTLGDIARDGAAIIVVSSDFQELSDLCDEILVIDKGRVCAHLKDSTRISARVIVHSIFGEPEK